MNERHYAVWPRGLPHHLTVPHTSLCYNLQVSAVRYPDKPCLIFYDTPVTYAECWQETGRIAAYLQQACGVAPGDRVLLYLQNSPQFVLAYYAILRAGAVVVPVNPMNLTDELRHYVEDTGARTVVVAQDLYAQVAPLLGQGLRHAVVATYADYLRQPTDLKVPEFVAAPFAAIEGPGVVAWRDMLAQGGEPTPVATGPDDLCVMPYTSGTTGYPKGCMHTHRNAMVTAVAGMQWFGTQQDAVALSVLPLFHVTGMQGGMNGPIFVGATLVLLARWDRDTAAECIRRHRVNALQLISTMVVDLLSSPRLAEYDLSSVRRMSGGGAAMPDAIAQKMHDLLAIDYVEGYGMSETIAPTHVNPPERPKKQCLGIPIFGVDARVIDPITLAELPAGEVGEIVVHGAQVMQGYWNNPEASAAAFVPIDGKRFLRTGDLGRVDAEGYFFMVDRLKRMINACGYKVWPAEVEALMYRHPAIREVCVVASHDERRGETVKAVVALKDGFAGTVSEQDIVDWAHANMAAYKSPRLVEFCSALPKSATGKVLWRTLQEAQATAAR
ncbi:long-chain fatty acid--CoA ligase [Pseudoduganella armeniaca]|uniref:Long-chain fatty acid--CoA ligase n=1 Tax=Pseudoduganella armeniaca TaxID=2072590 RepID=A0A2R4CIB5_9BURK|nr:long-chain fatty acid--CoA ligase [Pseudoduganella armeniaca]AVR99374.1 long-chain fatty acid--CoA ligase [Pseudoduganella armeniaca]